MPSQQPRAERIDYKIKALIQQCKYELWVKKIEEMKQWLVEFWQSTAAFKWKMPFLCTPLLPGSAEAQVIWGGIVKCLLIAYFIGNISVKIHSRVSKLQQAKGGTFFQTRCSWISTLHEDETPRLFETSDD